MYSKLRVSSCARIKTSFACSRSTRCDHRCTPQTQIATITAFMAYWLKNFVSRDAKHASEAPDAEEPGRIGWGVRRAAMAGARYQKG